MGLSSKRSLDRMLNLVEVDPRWQALLLDDAFSSPAPSAKTLPSNPLRRLLAYSGTPIPPAVIVTTSLLLAAGASYVTYRFFTPYLVPIYASLAAAIPFSFLDARASTRTSKFTEDYPTVLLATASSIKAGLTPVSALEGAVQPLSKDSLLRDEVVKLMKRLETKQQKATAVADFGSTIRLAELELFRRAFILVTEHGGRFAPTLERLASFTRDRITLTETAKVNTTSMRMTANILMFIVAPFTVSILSMRYPDFWNQLVNHPIANTAASIGITVITMGFVLLHRMSAFKP